VTATVATTASPEPSGTWAPLANRVYRTLWLAQLGSSVGTWMQTVGAQWLLVSQPHASTLVALVQTANLLPVMLLSLPAGVLADVIDRRRLLIAVQAGMGVVAALLAGVTAAGLTTPVVLLTLTFVLGCGAALLGPAWQAVQPELVPKEQIPAAATLGGLATNAARAVGPALAGALVAVTSAAVVFGVNALSFLLIVAALIAWRRPARQAGHGEHAVAALRAGTRYIRNAPAVNRLFLRAVLFVVPGSALWALLPVVAHNTLRLGSGGYGGLLGALGVGAVLGAVTLSPLRRKLSANQLLAAAGVVFGLGTLCLALVDNVAIASVALVLGGLAWLAALSTLNASLQLTLPAWVRARGLAGYLLVFQGGQALGAVQWGLLAESIGTGPALAVAAALLALGGLTVPLLPLLPTTATLDRTPVSHWPEPTLVFDPDPDDGPVLVLRRYRVPDDNVSAFLAAMEYVGHSRRRTGATHWQVYRDGEREGEYVEAFTVPSWDEHLRQHGERMTAADQQAEDRAQSLTTGDPTVEHLLPSDA
jgi:MFS family permease